MATTNSVKEQQLFNTAISEGDVTTIISLLQSGVIDLNHRDVTHDLQTPLMRLSHSDLGRSESVKDILDVISQGQAPDMNQQDAVGRTLAMHACIAHTTALLGFAVAGHCDIMVPDRLGRNLIHYAALSGNEEIVDIALSHPQAVQAVRTLDGHGYSPLDLAKQRKYSNISRKLLASLNNSASNTQTTQDKHRSPNFTGKNAVSSGLGINKTDDSHSSSGRSSEGRSPLGPLSNTPSPLTPRRRMESPRGDESQQRDDLSISHCNAKRLSGPREQFATHGGRHPSKCSTKNKSSASAEFPSGPTQTKDTLSSEEQNSPFHTAKRGFHPIKGINHSDRHVNVLLNKRKNGTEEDTNSLVSHNERTNVAHLTGKERNTGFSLPLCQTPNTKSASIQRNIISEYKQDTRINRSQESLTTLTDTSFKHNRDLGRYQESYCGKSLNDALSPRQQSLARISSRSSSQDAVNSPLSSRKLLSPKADTPRPDQSERMGLSDRELASLLSPRPRPRNAHFRDTKDSSLTQDRGVKSRTSFGTTDDRSSLNKAGRVPRQENSDDSDEGPHEKQLEKGDKTSDRSKRARQRRPSLSLPDLRDMTGCLVTSHETSLLQTLFRQGQDKRSGNSAHRHRNSGKIKDKNNDDDYSDDEDQQDKVEIDGASDSSLSSCFDELVSEDTGQSSGLPLIKPPP